LNSRIISKFISWFESCAWIFFEAFYQKQEKDKGDGQCDVYLGWVGQ